MENQIETLRQAATRLREHANQAMSASHGERWESEKHYDALYTVDLQPSLGVTDGPDSDNNYIDVPDCAPYEAPRFLAAVHEHAAYIAMLDPAVGMAIADWLDAAAEDIDDHELYDERIGRAASHAIQIAKLILREMI